MQSKQMEPLALHGDSRSEIRNGTERPDAPPALRVVEAPSSAPCRIEVDFKQLEDGRIVELVEDPGDATKTKLAVFDNGKIYVADSVDDHGQTLVPAGRNAGGLEDITLPRAPHPYQSALELFRNTCSLIESCVALPAHYPSVTAAVVMNSWFGDLLRPPMYLMLTGLPQSGKTTLLEIFRLLCRRPLLVSEITSAAAYQTCSAFGCTLLIDENEWRADRNSRTLRKLLRAGTTKDMLTRHLGKTQHAFGTKILSSVELPNDDALRSRCLHLPMNETDRTDLRKPWDPEIVKAADLLRGQFLQFRLERYASVSPRPIPGAEKLRPRSRDLLATLLAPLKGDESLEQLFLDYFQYVHDPLTRDLLLPMQAAVVGALFEFIHLSPETGYVQVGEVTIRANQILQAVGERFKMNPRECSDHLTSLGFNYATRSNRGARRFIDKEDVARIHKLRRDHGVRFVASADLKARTDACTLCHKKLPPTATDSNG